MSGFVIFDAGPYRREETGHCDRIVICRHKFGESLLVPPEASDHGRDR